MRRTQTLSVHREGADDLSLAHAGSLNVTKCVKYASDNSRRHEYCCGTRGDKSYKTEHSCGIDRTDGAGRPRGTVGPNVLVYRMRCLPTRSLLQSRHFSFPQRPFTDAFG